MKLDNRNYLYDLNSRSDRREYTLINSLVSDGSTVIDLGCGDGTLLAIMKKRGIAGWGMDMSKSAAAASKKKGIKAITGRIDTSLPFKDKQFDFAVCNVTLQMVVYPEILLSEMKRIAKKQIVSFPNFAFIVNRLELLFYGRMPKTMIPGYDWYSTGHLHQLSIADFEEFIKKRQLKILKRFYLYPKQKRFSENWFLFPNLLATEALYLLEADE
ncbi:MAG: SAM-dependent methyltransferase [Candidatus Gottesmanbacteria bacterium GW2011_GWA2_43_14]|uniref:SAM-dependent methyltransferase n=1 Tax=Candidatus Gottesmanbacteria bacterium GW2011_GWA2_43_14 TaxID=1618443 RepID=A0A0G1GIP0_9BACT|nr:MAG: SAM-dependent methyltransferase [Candidatus Gottesmanbacteria bacterium GW2011_GWA2_43_14]